MTARDELQQWVDGRPQWRSEAPISTDLARRVLAEMDEVHNPGRQDGEGPQGRTNDRE